MDKSDNPVVGSEVSINQSCFIQGNHSFSHVHLHPNSQINMDEVNYVIDTDPSLCNLFYEDELSSCLSDHNESVCVGICLQFENNQSCPVYKTLTTQSPTTSPAPSYSSSSTPISQEKNDDYSGTIENNVSDGRKDTNQQKSGEKTGFFPGLKEIIVGTLFVVCTVLLVTSFVLYRRKYGREKDSSDVVLVRQNSKIS